MKYCHYRDVIYASGRLKSATTHMSVWQLFEANNDESSALSFLSDRIPVAKTTKLRFNNANEY